MFRRLIAIFLFSICLIGRSSGQNWVWARQSYGIGQEGGESVAVDDSDYSYMAGSYFDSVRFSNTTIFTGFHYWKGHFLTKFSPNGNVVWCKSLFSSGYHSSVNDLEVRNGFIYMTGNSGGSTEFIPGGYIAGPGSELMFVAKYSLQGDLIWVRTFICETFSMNSGKNIHILSNGNIVVAGNFSGTVSFGTDTISTINNCDGVFVLEMDDNGNPIWLHGSDSNWHVKFGSMDIDSQDNIYITGTCESHTQFGNNLITPPVSSLGSAFITKFDANGNNLWNRLLGPCISGHDYVMPCKLDINDHDEIVITSTFEGECLFDTIIAGYTGQREYFLITLDQNGNAKWVFSTSNSHADVTNNFLITTDSNCNIYFSATWVYFLSFGSLYVQPQTQVFFMEFDSTGAGILAESPYGSGSACIDMSAERPGELFITGGEEWLRLGTTDLHGGIQNGEAFIAKFGNATLPDTTTSLLIYPNPAKDQFHIRWNYLNGSDAFVTDIYDMTGRLVLTGRFNGENEILDETIFVPTLDQGNYILEVTNGKAVARRLFMIE